MRSVICLLISALLISTTGCMTMRPLEATTALTNAIKVGDKVELIEKDGYINKFTVGKITEQFVAGTDERGSHVSIPLENVESVSVEKVDGGRTTLAVMGGIVAIPIVLFGAGAMVAACAAGGC